MQAAWFFLLLYLPIVFETGFPDVDSLAQGSYYRQSCRALGSSYSFFTKPDCLRFSLPLQHVVPLIGTEQFVLSAPCQTLHAFCSWHTVGTELCRLIHRRGQTNFWSLSILIPSVFVSKHWPLSSHSFIVSNTTELVTCNSGWLVTQKMLITNLPVSLGPSIKTRWRKAILNLKVSSYQICSPTPWPSKDSFKHLNYHKSSTQKMAKKKSDGNLRC